MVCVTPLYVAVTVAVTAEPLDTDVSVLDVWPDPFVVADVGDIEPEVVLKLIDFDPAALPPIVSVALIALVLTPSAGMELGLGESDSETVLSVSVVVAVRPLYVAVTVPDVVAVWAAAVNVIVVLTAEADAGDTLPTLAGLTATAVLDGSAVPAVVYFAVSVGVDVLWPSASTVADDGLSVSVMPL